MWNSIKVAGTILIWLWIDATAWLSTWQLEESWCTILDKVRVCVHDCVFVGGVSSSLSWKMLCSEMWHIGDKLCLHCSPSVFYITLLVVHRKSVSSHLYRYVELLTGHEFLIGAGNGEVKMKNNQVTFYMVALSSLLFGSVPLQLKLWIMMFLVPLTLPCICSPTNMKHVAFFTPDVSWDPISTQ